MALSPAKRLNNGEQSRKQIQEALVLVIHNENSRKSQGPDHGPRGSDSTSPPVTPTQRGQEHKPSGFVSFGSSILAPIYWTWELVIKPEDVQMSEEASPWLGPPLMAPLSEFPG